MLVSRKPAWFMASYAMPPVMAPSPMTWRGGAGGSVGPGKQASEWAAQRSPARPRQLPTSSGQRQLRTACQSHSAGAAHRNHIVLAALDVTAHRHAQRRRDGGGAVARAKRVVRRLGALGEACGRGGAARRGGGPGWLHELQPCAALQPLYRVRWRDVQRSSRPGAAAHAAVERRHGQLLARATHPTGRPAGGWCASARAAPSASCGCTPGAPHPK